VPLRSVEAATRDDAIAAAREQFGPSARVVGVRRVRSGGVLGFFATERYVAEVAPDVARPAVPAVTPGAHADDAPADFSSPLASAAPARARATAPARNGAAAWAAEAARTPESSAPSSSVPAPSPAAPAWQPTPAHLAAGTTVGDQVDDDRVSELASLLAAKKAEQESPTYARTAFPRATVARTGSDGTPSADKSTGGRVIRDDVTDTPSPFTAALARMVAGDRDVRQAVEEALVRPGAARPGAVRPARPAQSSEPPSPARQEEEPVGDQVIAPSSDTTRTVEVPTWAAEPAVAAPSHSPREEAIAEVLRSALAQGHSDEALAGILRRMLAGASPQSALPSPERPAPAPPLVVVDDDRPADVGEPVAVEVVAPEPVVEAPLAEFVEPANTAEEPPAPEAADPEPVAESAADESSAHQEPSYGEPASEPAPYEAPAAEASVFDLPVHTVPASGAPMFEVPVYQSRPDARPVEAFGTSSPTPPSWTPVPAWVASPTSMWDPPSMSATLWGEPVRPAPVSSTPIWAEVSAPVPTEPVDAALFEERVEVPAAEEDEAVVAEATPDEEVTLEADVVEETPVEETPVEESVVEETLIQETVAEEAVVEAAPEELAPVLARTASDPAPMMSFDSTSVMPPLSLLPPLPGSRGRGRPPVPPSPSRRSSASSAAPTAEPVAAPPATPAVSSTDDVWAALVAPAQPSLATVTRLPVAPLKASPEVPEVLAPEATEGAEVAVDEAPAAPATGEIADRLVELGVPRDVLGSTFAEDVSRLGAYAALTRALALRLPTAPELPNGAGEMLLVVGPGVETLRAAQSLAASLRLDPDRVQWATRGDLAGLAPESSRVTTVGAAISRRDDATVAGTLTIVAVDAPLRADAYWTAQMVSVWSPVAVWAVVEATRKPEDLEPWIDGLPQVDALIVQDSDLSADPAAFLRRVDTPVALVDGGRATPHRWASLLCERLENPRP
jgi:hypothetical protein